MSIDKLNKIFAAIPNCTDWSIQLLKIKSSKREGTSYIGREIQFTPASKLNEFISEISSRYTNDNNGVLKSFLDITEYDGSTIDKTVYTLSVNDELVQSEYNNLITAIATPD